MAESATLNAARESMQGTIEFSSPEWLWMLPVLFLATFLWRAMSHQQQPASLVLGNINLRYRMLHPLISLIPKSNTINNLPVLHVVVYSLILTSLIISLADPVRVGAKLPDPPQERDIIFIVDTSISMTLRDYVLDGQRIDRMTMLKSVLDRFIQQFPGERIGIIVFGDAAYTLVPLTRDQHLVRRMLSRIQATMVGRFNNMGDAIALAVKQSQQQSQVGRHQVLVMLTDADKPTGAIDPYTAADLALEAGIPIYTVSIGAATEKAEEKRTTGLIYEPVDIALLTAISEHTGAKNYQAGDANAFTQAVNDISQNETNQKILPPLYYRQVLYFWPLLFSAALLLCFIFLTTLKRSLAPTTSPSSHNEPEDINVNF